MIKNGNCMKYIATLFTTFLCLLGSAQQTTETVLYLKNGSILRGKLHSATEGKHKIELLGGSIFVVDETDLDSIKTESTHKRQLRDIKNNYYYKERGYRHITEFGMIYGTNIKPDETTSYYNTGDDFGVSLHTINGYQFWRYLYIGGGVGIDRMISYRQTFSPFYVRISSEFVRKKVSPMVYADGGYSIMWKQPKNEWYEYKNRGGYYFQAGAGLRIYTRSRASVLITAGYKRNYSETKWWYTQWNEGTYYTIRRTYQRVVMSVGVSF